MWDPINAHRILVRKSLEAATSDLRWIFRRQAERTGAGLK
jgi:hypothetical protein